MHLSFAHIACANPGRLINRLCKHWGHKFPVELDDALGRIELPIGECRLRDAGERLEAQLQAADAAALARLQQVVADHLERMASGEALTIVGQPGESGRATA
ncbi:DUF2218 domain-containing protein [Stutzerimonas balearica]|jgi:hypothetical protein|uniref:DUF2218 domain-containing protein n=1 Tax=Stutzerimonas balearica TaxID=74829 RepID=A0A9X7YSV5_9GAMM|nr:DUF2218 domain-containing protein [Stutzerimonas balearica]QQN51442.1 DUF2218 domain-containing protein [Stutzerimonas balearica]WAN11593.1 DUF2218 domain-containing protein [Stutzerimonas balearica]